MNNLENQTAEYRVRVVKEGDGAKQAAQEFQQLDTAYKTASSSANNYTATLRATETGLKGTANAMRGLGNVVQLVGFSQFPQATAQLMLFQNALGGIRNVSAATGASLGAVGAGVAGLTAIVISGAKAFEQFKARQQEAATAGNLSGQTPQAIARTIQQINARAQAGAISPEMQTELLARLNSAGNDSTAVTRVMASLRANTAPGMFSAEAGQQFLDSLAFQSRLLQAQQAFRTAGGQRDLMDPFADISVPARGVANLANRQAAAGNISREELDAIISELGQATQLQRLQQATADAGTVTGLARREGSPEQQRLREVNARYESMSESVRRFYEMERELAGENAEAIAAINAKEADSFAQLQREKSRETSTFYREWIQFTEVASQAIAATLARGIVDAFREGKFEAREFFSSLAAMIAELALQIAILNVFRSIGFGGALAANGIQMPKMFAAGGVAGVRDVAGATYFPDFNVVAGEAGREVMTVLSRPRLMSVGGMAAQVGNVGAQKLAIVNFGELSARMGTRFAADGMTDLAMPGGAGGGGSTEILVTLDPGLRASIVNQSVGAATVRVRQQMREHGDMNRAVQQAQS